MNQHCYGQIIRTSSGALQLPPPGLAIYVAAKVAVMGFMRATAVECGTGVTANMILPGLIATEIMNEKCSMPDGSEPFPDMLIQKQAVKPSGRPEDIAQMIWFIASLETVLPCDRFLMSEAELPFISGSKF
jgi:3-oxoacyl-[acyl-carrier protein] reductase